MPFKTLKLIIHLDVSLDHGLVTLLAHIANSHLSLYPILYQAMQMKGGGPFYILPGQFTDDSEMSVALLKGLLSYNELKTIKQQKLHILTQISKQYVSWLDSEPFDIGQTCFNALYHIKNEMKSFQRDFDEQKLDKIKQQIFNLNGSKESNGSLMRMAPMAVFYSMFESQKQQLKDLIKSEIELTHPNKKLIKLGLDWMELTNNIINRNQSKLPFKNIYQEFFSKQLNTPNNPIQDYIQQVKVILITRGEMMDGIHQMGWAKIAFSYSLNQLKYITNIQEKTIQQNSQQIYKDVIRKVMKQGGDTDTNCAIVGSILGSIIGFKGLPQEYVQKMMNLNLSYDQNSNKGTSWNRPLKYEPRRAFLSMLKLLGKLNPRYKII